MRNAERHVARSSRPVGAGADASEPQDPRTDAHRAVLDAASFEAVVSREDAREERYRRPTTVVVLELDGLERLVGSARRRSGRPGRTGCRRHHREAGAPLRLCRAARTGPVRCPDARDRRDRRDQLRRADPPGLRRVARVWRDRDAAGDRLGKHGRQRLGDDGDAGRGRSDASRAAEPRSPCGRRRRILQRRTESG